MSMNPGITVLPAASMIFASAPQPVASGASTALMRLPWITTVAGRTPPLTASNSRPPRMANSGPVSATGFIGMRTGYSLVRASGPRNGWRSLSLGTGSPAGACAAEAAERERRAATTVTPREVLARDGWRDSFAFMAGDGFSKLRTGPYFDRKEPPRWLRRSRLGSPHQAF